MWPNSKETADLVTFTEKILNGKLHFFVQWMVWNGFLPVLNSLSSDFNIYILVIICKIFRSYKHQAIWSLVAVSKSSYPTRSGHCKEIFHEVCCDNIAIKRFVKHSLELTDRLLEVSNRKCGSKETKLYMKRDFPTLVRLLSSG